MSWTVLSLLAALVLAAVHATAGYLRALEAQPRSRWLSAAGGVSVAYVFLHLLPELAEFQEVLAEATEETFFGFLEHHIWLVALGGLALFYGLERLVRRHRRERPVDGESATGVFWLHMASFSVYNALVGYLLVHWTGGEEEPAVRLAWYVVAMALHFLVTDTGLRHDHRTIYQRVGRWILVAAIVAGWAIGTVVELSEEWIGLLAAFVGGGVVLNVLKEELPEERESRYWAFLTGAAGYAVLLYLA